MRLQMPPRGPARQWTHAAVLSGAFFGLGLVWVIVADRFALNRALGLESADGRPFYLDVIPIAASAAFVLFLARHLLQRIDEKAERLALSREALHRSEQRAMAGLFAASLAHDGNNLVAVIQPNLAYARRKLPAEGDVGEALGDAEHAVERLAELFRRLRDAGRHKVGGPCERIRLAPAVAEAVGIARTHLRVKYCAVDFVGDPEIELDVQPGLIHQMVMNLVLNAADATEGRGRIEVRVQRIDAAAVIEVHDDGPGVPRENRRKIFEAFYTSKQHGTGLGLVSARACAETHGGRVRVDDSPLGGACFRVTLPLLPVEVASPSTSMQLAIDGS